MVHWAVVEAEMLKQPDAEFSAGRSKTFVLKIVQCWSKKMYRKTALFSCLKYFNEHYNFVVEIHFVEG